MPDGRVIDIDTAEADDLRHVVQYMARQMQSVMPHLAFPPMAQARTS